MPNNASLDRITKQATALLNANTRSTAGVPNYTAAIGDNARHASEIEASIYNAALMTARAICESASSPFRADFLADVAVTHGAAIPFHYGDTSIPVITPYQGATETLKGTRKAFDKIESYRTNKNNVYAETAHNAADDDGNHSKLAGFYDIVNGIFYFTGKSATMKLANFNRTDVFAKLNEAVEPTIIKLALGLSAKEGDASDGLFAAWYQQGMSDLNEIKAGGVAFSPIDEAIAGRGNITR